MHTFNSSFTQGTLRTVPSPAATARSSSSSIQPQPSGQAVPTKTDQQPPDSSTSPSSSIFELTSISFAADIKANKHF
eukprot:jgi/Chrzof1/10288/Cz04g36020.t1